MLSPTTALQLVLQSGAIQPLTQSFHSIATDCQISDLCCGVATTLIEAFSALNSVEFQYQDQRYHCLASHLFHPLLMKFNILPFDMQTKIFQHLSHICTVAAAAVAASSALPASRFFGCDIESKSIEIARLLIHSLSQSAPPPIQLYHQSCLNAPNIFTSKFIVGDLPFGVRHGIVSQNRKLLHQILSKFSLCAVDTVLCILTNESIALWKMLTDSSIVKHRSKRQKLEHAEVIEEANEIDCLLNVMDASAFQVDIGGLFVFCWTLRRVNRQTPQSQIIIDML